MQTEAEKMVCRELRTASIREETIKAMRRTADLIADPKIISLSIDMVTERGTDLRSAAFFTVSMLVQAFREENLDPSVIRVHIASIAMVLGAIEGRAHKHVLDAKDTA